MTESDENKEENIFKDFAKNNSVGGLSKVLTGDSIIRRIAWLVILLACCAVSLYTLRKDFRKIINRPTSTIISTTAAKTLDFPAVTVCNLNTFSKTLANSKGGTGSTVVQDIRTVYQGTSDVCKSMFTNSSSYHSSTKLEALMKDSPESLISKCRFGGIDCNISSDFILTPTRLGVCFTFNSGQTGRPVLKANGTGVRNGLQLQLNIDQDDYIATLAGDAGIKIAVHPQSEPPLPDELGVAVPPGNNAFISFRKHRVVDKAKHHCKKPDQTLGWNFLRNEFDYSKAACLVDSFYTRVADLCKCSVTNTSFRPDDPPHTPQRACSFVDLCCIFQQYTTPVKEPCVPACSYEEYRIAGTSYSRFPAAYLKQSTPRLSLTTENSSSANIFFETLLVENRKTEISYGVEELFAEVGGQLGLLIGVNATALFELLFLLYDAIVYCVRYKSYKALFKRLKHSHDTILGDEKQKLSKN